MKKHVAWITFCLWLIPALAMPGESIGDYDVNTIVEKMLHEGKKVMEDYVSLSPKEARSFWPVYEQYQNELRPVLTMMLTLGNKYKDNYQTLSNSEKAALIDKVVDLKMRELTLKRHYFRRYRKILPPKKMLRVINVDTGVEVGFIFKIMLELPEGAW